ncbi:MULTISPECIES: hypothetical protein [Methylobacterium]|uniref:Uncharacterized protein n=1 Tax=Methylobacterium radiotolerans (strain ATCC 27329 / DSM 1819 / JCM 2831 / NBRC 15690 / NCIMB 10815 / 0-1) TaxID=426355 RepID=B1M177_METRJ|nr:MULTISPECIES: hypothetical protein [Methylobacterium]ACB24627.1 hypothetical protein Mrad2831_2643 [Methylobacterium radiotolerans JCM 2831]MBE7248533.1 hypothetical protein [Actinomycetospora chiangmaiensis]GEM97100.1 hypothetical protein MRA01_16400 [Methylobacterium radiotolerans]
MMFFDLFVLVLGLSCVWEVLAHRAALAAGVGDDWFTAVNLAASVWLLAVLAISGPLLLLAVFKLPCVVVFLIAAWRAFRRVVATRLVAWALGRQRKVA